MSYLRICLQSLAVIAGIMQAPCYSMDYAGFESQGTEAQLIVQRLETDFNYGDISVNSRINRIGMTLYEPSYPTFQPGLQLGAFEINQDNNPVTSGINLNGNYLGVVFRSSLFRTDHSAMRLDGSYAYHSADKTLSNQDINLRWHEFMFDGYVQLSYGNLDFSLGGYRHSIDGDETAFGIITQTREFEEKDNTGIHAGLEYWVDATGKVGVHVDNGGGREISLIFAREF